MRRRHCVGLVVLAMLMVFVGPSRAQDGLVAHYTFEEGPGDTIKDWSDHGNEGKNLGAKYVSLPDGKGFALSFDTPDAHVDCGSDSSLDLTGPLTIELWFYTEDRLNQGQTGLVGKNHDSYLLAYDSACVFFVTTGSGGRQNRTHCSMSADIGRWRHIVATFDGENVTTYTDGKLKNTRKAKSPKVRSVKKSLYLRYPVVWGDKVEPLFKCMMDDVRIYNRALSEAEVIRHYNDEIKERPDIPWFEGAKLDWRVLAPTSTLMVTADLSRMVLRSAGAGLRLQLREPNRGEVVAQHEEAVVVPESGRTECLMSVKGLAPGEYELRAQVMRHGVRIGIPSSVRVKLSMDKPAWAAAYDDVKVLNNLVAELLAVHTRHKEPQATYEFTNPRDGWIFIHSTAKTQGSERVTLSLDSPDVKDAVIVHTSEEQESLEAMRHVPAGRHTLHVNCDGVARPGKLIIRAIPEIIPTDIGYYRAPIVPAYGPYPWEVLDRINLLQNGNVLVDRGPQPENAKHLTDWRRQGKKVLAYYNVAWVQRQYDPVTTGAVVQQLSGGLRKADLDGIIIDEWASSIGSKEYVCFSEAIEKIAANPMFKDLVVYPYSKVRYARERAKPAVKSCIDAGYKLCEEVYLAEQPTETAMRNVLNQVLRRNILLYNDTFPDDDCARHMIMTLGYCSGPPHNSDVYPGADYKVYLDTQMNLLANDPTFFGLYGVQWYHIGYVNEEILRWSAKLLRHYCIEGKRDRLTDDPYVLPHITNGDFDQGADGWTIKNVEEDSVSVRWAPGYGGLQGRVGSTGVGDVVLVTRRAANGPNRISQTIKKLTPGRTYSVTMFIMDFAEHGRGKSVEQPHPASVRLERVELLPERSFRVVYGSGEGRSFGPFDSKNQLYITYYRDVFRAREQTAEFILSDWAGEKDPGGPIGQELGFNFIQIQPYLED